MSLKCASAAGEFTAETRHFQERWITPTDPWRQVGLFFSVVLHDFSWNPLWRSTDSHSCHLADVTAHKYHVVGQSPTRLQHLGMLSRCAAVLGNAGSRSGKYDRAHLVLTAVQVLAHLFTRASEVPAEHNSVAWLSHRLLSDLFIFLSCRPHRTIAGREILVAGPIVPTTPCQRLRGPFFIWHRSSQIMSRAGFLSTWVWVTCCRNTPQKHCCQLWHSL